MASSTLARLKLCLNSKTTLGCCYAERSLERIQIFLCSFLGFPTNLQSIRHNEFNFSIDLKCRIVRRCHKLSSQLKFTLPLRIVFASTAFRLHPLIAHVVQVSISFQHLIFVFFQFQFSDYRGQQEDLRSWKYFEIF